MPALRLMLRSLLLIPYLLWGLVLALTIVSLNRVRSTPVNTAPIARTWLSGLCRVLGLQIQVNGELAEEPTLVVSNHISWIDIPVLGALKPLRFLSKVEVREWPLIGFLAEQAGTLFIRRGGGQAGKVQEEIAGALRSGETVLLFPEGTTTDGQSVRRFHPRLLKSAQATGRAVQPVTLHYRRQGTPDLLAPFIGDDEFFSHLLRLLKAPPTEVYIVVHPALPVTEQTDMLALTRDAQQRVEHALTYMYWHNQPHAPVYPQESLSV